MEVSLDYRSHLRSSSDNDSDDSDNECAVWKRASKKPVSTEKQEINFEPNQTAPASTSELIKSAQKEQNVQNSQENNSTSLKRKRNRIWCDIIQEQIITETLIQSGIKNKPKGYGSRGEESYDYTLAYTDPRNIKESENCMSDKMSQSSEEEPGPALKRKKFRRSYHSDGISDASFDYKRDHMKNKMFVKLEKDELEAARKIVRILNEKKQYIIYRAVKIAGIDKALSLLKMTEEIEENGGMMIQSHSRRRTPGGVYLQLLKSDKDITKDMIDKIFEGEMSGEELKKYYAECKKRRAEEKKLQKEKRKLLLSLKQVECKSSEQNETEPIEVDAAPVKDLQQNELKAKIDSDLEDGEISE